MDSVAPRVVARWRILKAVGPKRRKRRPAPTVHTFDEVGELRENDLRGLGLRAPYRSLHQITIPYTGDRDRNTLKAKAIDWAEKYESGHWPGGSAEVVAYVEFMDVETPVITDLAAVISFYYSPS